jgi:hypothetical protein
MDLCRRPFLVAESGDGVEQLATGAMAEDAVLNFERHAQPKGKGTDGAATAADLAQTANVMR